jgi:hypothetical protein
MPDILDVDVSEAPVAYDLVIARQREWDAAVIEYVRQKHGVTWQPNDANFRHLLFRVISEERRIWRTTRNALDDRPGTTDHGEPDPGTGGEPGVAPSVIKVSDGPFHPRLYSYWANAFVQNDQATYVFAARVYQQPTFFRIDRHGAVQELGAVLPYRGETEGWYWDLQGFVYVPQGPRLLRHSPFSGAQAVAAELPPQLHDHYLWQAHSSDDGETHSATLREGGGRKVGTVAWRAGRFHRWDPHGDLDESIVTSDGRHIVILEDRYNRIINLDTLEERRITQEQGAVGHCDTGRGFVVGEDDHHGACVYWNLDAPLDERNRRELLRTWNLGHVSVRGVRALLSNATAKELALVDVHTGSYTTLFQHGVDAQGDYDRQVRANLSPCGRRATFLLNGALYVMAVPP